MISNFDCLSELISDGLALIPIQNGSKKPFEPFKGTKPFSGADLAAKISAFDASSVAFRVGTISGGVSNGSRGLICIDVDSKHKEGFSERIYGDIQTLYPEIFEKLLIDRTPSGGLHFYYILIVGVGANFPSTCDLASRKCTEEELSLDPSTKKKAFLELKASDGSLSQCFPSVGYSRIFGGNKIKELTEDEHSYLISLCFSYNEVEKVEPTKIKTVEKSNYEDGQTPFDQFNISLKGAEVLTDLGWRFYKTSGIYDQYIKPGNNKNNIGATFNRSTKIYKIFTSNSNIDQRAYNPSSLLCKYKYNGDWSTFYKDLVSEGYGTLLSRIEKSIIKRSIKFDTELPANISEKGISIWKEEKEKWKTDYKFGIFWEEDDKGAYSISRESLYDVSREMGFRIYKDKIVVIDDLYIKLVDDRFYYNKLKEYLGDCHIDLKDCYENFLQNSGKFTITRLDILNEDSVLKSTKYVSYKFYKNCYVCITSDGLEILSYSELNQLIWFQYIKNRDFVFVEEAKGLYFDFIKNAIGWSEYVMKCIGYYAHDYRDEEGYLMVASERCEHSKDGGGSGKNIFWKLFSLITTFKSTAAEMIKKDTQFLQSWNYERVFVMADLPNKFDLIFFKDMVTDGAVVKKLYKDEFNVDVSEMAKLGASTNYSVDNSDPGLKRRVRFIEFTNYYTKLGGVKTATGKMFPKDWDEQEYLFFDNIMAECIRVYLKSDCVIEESIMSEGGYIKQFEQKYNHLYDFIKMYIEEWKSIGKVSNSMFNLQYKEFLEEANIKKGLSSFTINKAVEDYCVNQKEKFKLDAVWREHGKLVRGRLFGEGVKEEKEVDLPF